MVPTLMGVATVVLAGCATTGVTATPSVQGAEMRAFDAPSARGASSGAAGGLADLAPPASVVRAVEQACGEGTVTGSAEWVRTSTRRVESVISDGTGPAADVPVYAVHLHGDFVLDSAPRPLGAKSPSGTDLVLLLPIADNGQGGGGLTLTRLPVSLSGSGEVHTFDPGRVAGACHRP